MKKIEAIIRKSKFDEVRDALHEIEVHFFTYWDVTGVGNAKKGRVYRGVTYSTTDIRRRMLSIVVSDHFVEKTVKVILEKAFTGEVGDGKVFVMPIEEAYRIRTNEKGTDYVDGRSETRRVRCRAASREKGAVQRWQARERSSDEFPQVETFLS